MTCQECAQAIGDYMDRVLAPAARNAVEAHLATCDGCRALADDLIVIRTTTRILEPLAPPERVWSRISAAALTAPPAAPSRLRQWWWQPVAAAAMAVLVATGLWGLGRALHSAGSATARAGAVVVNDADASADAGVDQEGYFAAAIATLEQATVSERDTLDPATADVLRTGMTVLDEAIAESRAALTENPGNPVAEDSLIDALRRKVALLQYTFALINEMRKANSQGAARIVAEMSQ